MTPSAETVIRAFCWDAPVLVDGEPLDLAASLKVWNHSPSGFAWGYAGSGPAQLALAILLRFTDDETASRLHQRFKFDHVARWPQAGPLDERVNVQAWLAVQQ
jgi:hypothetical protein